MSNVWRKTLVYLGLVEESEEGDERARGFGAAPDVAEDRREREPISTGAARAGGSNVRPFPAPATAGGQRGSSGRVAVVRPTSFEDAEEIGGRYRDGQPVLFDLGGLDTDEAKRILDFVSGVTYALEGRLLRAGRRAFLLRPEGLELSAEERDRLAELGYDPEA